MKTLSLLSCPVMILFFTFNTFANDIYEDYQRESISRYEGMEETEYFRSLENSVEESSPRHEKNIRADREEALRSIRLKPGKRDESLIILENLARSGDVESMRELARLYELNHYPSAAYAWYRKASESGDKFSRYYLEEFRGRKVHRLGKWTTDDDHYRGHTHSVLSKALTPEEKAEAEMIYQEISQ